MYLKAKYELKMSKSTKKLNLHHLPSLSRFNKGLQTLFYNLKYNTKIAETQ